MSGSEFPRPVKVRPHPPQAIAIEANPSERAALAGRLGIGAVSRLTAEVAFDESGTAIDARGRLLADLVQACAVSGEDFAVRIDQPLNLRFVRTLTPVAPDEEIELDAEEPDEIEYDGETIDLGEAVAQSLALAIDPYAEGPEAEAARRAAGIVDESAPRGALAEALAALRRD